MANYLFEPQFQAELPFTAEASITARAQLRSFARTLTAGTIDDAVLMVSELVTNAFQHGRPDITLRFALSPDSLSVAVTDGGEATVPRTSQIPGRDQPSGRGLLIVDALAAHWGVRRADRAVGNIVWFDLARTKSSQSPPGLPPVRTVPIGIVDVGAELDDEADESTDRRPAPAGFADQGRAEADSQATAQAVS